MALERVICEGCEMIVIYRSERKENLYLSQPKAEKCAYVPFDVVKGDSILVSYIGEIEYHR